MSLVGSLEDLGLGDILQIIHLSGKSGVLVLRASQGEAEILFSNGLVRGAFAKGGPTTLAELLVARGTVPAEAVADAAEDAQHRGSDLVTILGERGLADADTVDAVRREHIESSVIELFGWPAGEFSFEIREVPLDSDSDGFFATPGVNPQFMALEGTRMLDEGTFGDEPEGEAGPMEMAAEESAHVIAAATAAAEVPADDDVLELPALSERDLVAPDDSLLDEPSEGLVTLVDAPPEVAVAVEAEEATPDLEAVALEAPSEPVETAAEISEEEAPVVRELTPPPVVLVDPELPVLEWAKSALGASFPQVHIFQSTDLAIARIRQYLARTRVPLVVLASDVLPDPVSGAEGPYELLRRLRRQSARISVAVLAPRSHKIQAPTDAAPDVVVRKPTLEELGDSRGTDECEELAGELVQDLLATAQRAGIETPRIEESEASTGQPVADISRLRESSARIRDGASHGDVLPQVLAFAGEAFERVALFMIRDDRAIGIAQAGLSRAGGPDEAALRELHIGAREPSWFRTVLDSGQAHRGSAVDDGDQRLAVMLGNEIAPEVYVAPIQTGDGIIALVYADNLPSRAPLGDTAALEVLLDSAGIALERALLERELAAFED